MNDKIKKEKEDKIIETASENVKVEESIVEVVEEKKDESNLHLMIQKILKII